MRKIKLLTKGLTKPEIEAAKLLALGGGCALEEIELVATLDAPDTTCDDEIVLVVMSPTVCADPELETELKKTPNGGRRAICVWQEDGPTKPEAPPAAVSKYAYSIIPWSADKFRAVAADDDVMCFEAPDGVALPKVKMEHNCCVDPEAKPK